jgi:hypothetical protein
VTLVAFAGPSLTREDRARFPEVEWRSPAAAGDLLCLAGAPGLRICLIDGFFDHRPAPRHKELLHLLAAGAEIYGAASIGALRAAEMHSLGMVGIGRIYTAYASGRLTGDDEVALAHGPVEWDWRPLSIPLVDVRATLCRAVRARVIGANEARSLRDAARAIFYVERTWRDVLEQSAVSPSSRRRLEDWLPDGEVSQKRLDALACLSAASRRSAPRATNPPAVRTVFLEMLARECGVSLGPPPTPAQEG